MASIAIGPAPADANGPAELRRRLARDHRIVVPLMVFGDRLWLRISVQLYNEWPDYEALRVALDDVIGD